jgi:hypothetical protein
MGELELGDAASSAARALFRGKTTQGGAPCLVTDPVFFCACDERCGESRGGRGAGRGGAFVFVFVFGKLLRCSYCPLPAACCVLRVVCVCCVRRVCCAAPACRAAPACLRLSCLSRLPCRACLLPAWPACLACLPGLPAWLACLPCLPGLLPACLAALVLVRQDKKFLVARGKRKSSLPHAAREKVPCYTRQEKKFPVAHGKRKTCCTRQEKKFLVARGKRKTCCTRQEKKFLVARGKRKSSLLHVAREKFPVTHDRGKSSLLHATRENQGQGKARSKLSCWCCPADGAAGLRRLVLLPHFLRRLGPPQPNARELMNLALMKPRMEEERKTARERASCKEEEQISAAQVRARSTFLTKTIFTDSAQGTENEDRKNKSRKGETNTAREEDKRERKRERRQLRRWET